MEKVTYTDDDNYATDFVFNMNTSKAYIGSLINPIQEEKVLVDIYEVELTEPLDTSICLPRPKWTLKSKADYLLLLENGQKIALGQQETCSTLVGSNKNVESVYQTWIKSRIMPGDEYGFLNLFKVKQETSVVNPSKVKIPFISEIKMTDFEKELFNLTIFNGQPESFKMIEGSIDQNFQLHGTCYLGISKAKVEFVGTHPMLLWTPVNIKGKFVHGVLEGPVRIVTNNNNIIFATFKKGVMHGPVFAYGLSLILKDKYEAKGFIPKPAQELLFSGTHFQGFFKNGQAFGHFWIQMVGGGHLHGQVSPDGMISGNDISYIYQDGETALLGKFEDRVMKQARQH